MSSQRTSAGAARKELQRQRPPPLKLRRESQKIRKPVRAVPSIPSTRMFNISKPMIIYMESPKIIHAEVRDFMTLVQRLTGSTSSSYTRSCNTNNENLTADHDTTIISQASDVTTLSQPAESVDQNMGSFRTDNTPCDSNTTSLENDRNQEIESRASGPEATDRAQPAVDSILFTPSSPFSPNFIFPSQRLLSPSIFKDLPLFSPDSNNFFYRLSEPMVSPQRSP